MDGALAFALPTVPGQSLRLTESNGSEIIWKSYDPKGQLWFQAAFDLMDFRATKSSDSRISDTLSSILKAASRANSDFLSHWKKYKVDTFLEFEKDWGMGSSSTLISCIAQWADINPYHLLFDTIGGSGFDVACAGADGPILYRLGDDELDIHYVEFAPPFLDHLYLVYLGRKQDSKAARGYYENQRGTMNGTLDHISEISQAIPDCDNLKTFEQLILDHENIVSKALNLPKVRDQYFGDYWGVVKSLGAWGGDFILATSEAPEAETQAYFREKGFETILKLREVMRVPVVAEADV